MFACICGLIFLNLEYYELLLVCWYFGYLKLSSGFEELCLCMYLWTKIFELEYYEFWFWYWRNRCLVSCWYFGYLKLSLHFVYEALKMEAAVVEVELLMAVEVQVLPGSWQPLMLYLIWRKWKTRFRIKKKNMTCSFRSWKISRLKSKFLTLFLRFVMILKWGILCVQSRDLNIFCGDCFQDWHSWCHSCCQGTIQRSQQFDLWIQRLPTKGIWDKTWWGWSSSKERGWIWRCY